MTLKEQNIILSLAKTLGILREGDSTNGNA